MESETRIRGLSALFALALLVLASHIATAQPYEFLTDDGHVIDPRNQIDAVMAGREPEPPSDLEHKPDDKPGDQDKPEERPPVKPRFDKPAGDQP